MENNKILERKVSYNLFIAIPSLGIEHSKEGLSDTEINAVYNEITHLYNQLSSALGKYNTISQKRTYTPRSLTHKNIDTIVNYANTHDKFTVKEIMNVIGRADTTTSSILKTMADKGQIDVVAVNGNKKYYGKRRNIGEDNVTNLAKNHIISDDMHRINSSK